MVATAGLVDFHCHLDLYPDYPTVVRETEKSGVFTLAVATTPQAWPRNHDLAQRTKHVRAALGLHPQLVAGVVRVRSVCGNVICPRHATSVKLALMLVRGSINHWMFKSGCFSMSCSAVLRLVARSSRSTVSGR